VSCTGDVDICNDASNTETPMSWMEFTLHCIVPTYVGITKHKLEKLYKESWSVQLFSLKDWGKSCKTSARLANWFLGCVRHMIVHTWSSSAITLPHMGLRFVSDSVLKKCFIKSSSLFYMYCSGVSFFWKESISNTWDKSTAGNRNMKTWKLVY
jgi:hypothetical protein